MSLGYSDSTLDALASGPQLGLRWLIVDVRRAFRYETPDRLHQRHTSRSPGDELDARGWPADADEGGVGQPFSAKMHRYLGTNRPRYNRGPDPKVRPAMASIVEISEWCHARHTSHLRPGYGRSLCAEMVFQVGYLGQEPEDVAWRFNLSLEQAEKMLAESLRHAYSWRVDTEARRSRQPGTDAPLPERRPLRPAI